MPTAESYKCDVCKAEFGDYIAANNCEKKHQLLARLKAEEELKKTVHWVTRGEMRVFYTLDCCKCKKSFEVKGNVGCMGPDNLEFDEAYKCTHCGHSASLNEENAESIEDYD